MAIPEKTVNDLLVKAFYLINEYSPEEYPSAFEIAEALDYLNEFLDSLSGNSIYIPYVNEFVFDLSPQKATYIFSQNDNADVKTNKIVEIFDAYLNFDGINIPLTQIQHDEAYHITRYPQAYTRPTQILLHNKNFESLITFFATPDKSYEVTINAKQVLNNLELQQEITNVPKHYHRFLRYAIARELSSVFETNSWTDLKEKEYQKMFDDLCSSSETDWSLNASGILMRKPRGWTKESIIVG